MKCSVNVESGRTPLVRWRLSGAEYSPGTLPDRFNANSTGLTIDPITSDDNELKVQCYILMVDPPIVKEHNSSVSTIRVQLTDSVTQAHEERGEPTTAAQELHVTSGASSTNFIPQLKILSILCVKYHSSKAQYNTSD